MQLNRVSLCRLLAEHLPVLGGSGGLPRGGGGGGWAGGGGGGGGRGVCLAFRSQDLRTLNTTSMGSRSLRTQGGRAKW